MPILEWLDKDKAVTASKSVQFRLLKEVPEYSYGDKNTGNMIVHGDNLEALKALLPYYKGRVKCIFIDPPYNTGSAFAQYDDNLEHSIWLSMMYPRLELLCSFLKEDGSLWVSIDDGEAHYLKILLDEILGRRNFVATVVWRSSDNSNNDAKQFSLDHNYILVYSKTIGWQPNKLPRSEEQSRHYNNPDNDPRGPWFDGNPLNSPNPRPNLTYDIIAPNGNIIKPPFNGWRWSKETLKEKMQSGEIRFNSNFTNIKRRTYLLEQKGVPPSTLWIDLDETGHNRQAKYEQKKLFPELNKLEWFQTPKPEKLLRKIIFLATDPGDIVMDTFLGSGTTTAVAQKMNRHYIGVELEETAVTHVVPRMQKVVDGEQGGISEAEHWQGGGGYKFYRLDEPLYNAKGLLNKNVEAKELGAFIWYKETQTSLPDEALVPYLGTFDETSYYLMYDKEEDTSLSLRTLKKLEVKQGKKVIYADLCKLTKKKLQDEQIMFKQIPYDIAKLGR